MVTSNVIVGIVALIIIVVLVIAAVFGFGLLRQPSMPAQNATANVTKTSTATATAKPSGTPSAAPPTPTPSGQQIAVIQGQTFTIALSANPSTGYQWTPTFDAGALSLKSQTFVSNATSTRLVGVGGTDLFTFQALRAGTTSVTFDYVSPGGQTTQSVNHTVIVR
ncbi:MAG: protease inhibitor I42 family protein [Halobacteriota archaeon]